MYRLTMILYAVIGTTMMGIGVTAVLAANMPGWKPVALAAAVGAFLAIPASWLVARRMVALTRN